jgi:hypothetical protein
MNFHGAIKDTINNKIQNVVNLLKLLKQPLAHVKK